MPSVPTFPTIPEPRNDVEALFQSVQALKLGYEKLVGATGVFVQNDQPAATRRGELWIQPDNGNMSYWDGNQWRLLP